MEKFTPLSAIEPTIAETGDEFAVPPFATSFVKSAIEFATDVVQEMLPPELTNPQRQQTKKSSEAEELDIALSKMELELQLAQRPGRMFSRIVGEPEQAQIDAHNLAAVRSELAELTPRHTSVDRQEFVMQQAMHVKSAVGMSESPRVDVSSEIPQQASTEA